MPRKRKAARAFVAESRHKSVHNAVRARFPSVDSLEMIFLQVCDFYTLLPTPAHRAAFCEIYPEKFYWLFEFEHHPSHDAAANLFTAFGVNVFRRDNFLAWLAQHPPRVPFDPPDCTGTGQGPRFREGFIVRARARAEWWKANDWPVNAAEAEWRVYDGPRATTNPRAKLLSFGSEFTRRETSYE